MEFEIITKQDLETNKEEIIDTITSLLKNMDKPQLSNWGKGKDLKLLFGGIGDAKIHALRNAGLLKWKEIGGTFIYDLGYAAELLESDTKLDVKINTEPKSANRVLTIKKK